MYVQLLYNRGLFYNLIPGPARRPVNVHPHADVYVDGAGLLIPTPTTIVMIKLHLIVVGVL